MRFFPTAVIVSVMSASVMSASGVVAVLPDRAGMATAGSSIGVEEPTRARGPSGVRLRRPDGSGTASQFAGNPPIARGGFFPVAVWFESVLEAHDVRLDKEAGINTYLELTENSDLDLVRRSGMRTIVSWGDPRTDGFLLPDEVDMWAGPGDAEWTGNWPGQGDVCRPSNAPCGYTVIREQLASAPAGKYIYGQFGKGMTFWQSREQARGYVPFTDALSADNYWFTDPNICGVSEGGWFFGTDEPISQERCRRPLNYGLTVKKVRSLVVPRASKPVWVFVELGHPAGESDAPTITPTQIRQAVWSGLIHGARGVVYFNHSFGGSCQSQHLLRESCMSTVRKHVSRLNAKIHRLSPLLNARFVDGLVTRRGDIDVSAKLHRGRFNVIVGHRSQHDARGAVKLACGGNRVAVDRATGQRIRIRHGRFPVALGADQGARIFRLVGGGTCGLS